MLRTMLLLLLVLPSLAIALVGCGSGGSPLVPAPSPAPGPPAGGDTVTHEVGPLLVRTAAAPGFVAEEISSYGDVSLAALYGSTIEYLASQALLDRIVFTYGGASPDIWVCNLDGSGRVKLTDNAAIEETPCWSPDGTMIAFSRQWPAQDSEVILMNADGSGIRALTSNTDLDGHPSFGPTSRRIAFETDRDGNLEVYTMFLNGGALRRLTNHIASDKDPDWSPDLDNSRIVFASNRDAAFYELYEVSADGGTPMRLTMTPTMIEENPDCHPSWSRTACDSVDAIDEDIFVTNLGGVYTPWNLSASPGHQQNPSWSSDGRFICYASDAGGDWDLVVQEAEEPWQKFAVTRAPSQDHGPDLGSPTMQADRVLIGPAGSDWGGHDPIWSSAYALIAAYSYRGYANLVRIGIRTADLDTLEISALSHSAANGLVAGPGGIPGVVLEAAEVVNLREDAGRGREPTVWDLDPLDPTAVVLYFDTYTAKLISVLVLDDAAYPSAAGSPPAVTERPDDSGIVVTGRFAAVFDSAGTRIAGPSSCVTIGADGAVNAI